MGQTTTSTAPRIPLETGERVVKAHGIQGYTNEKTYSALDMQRAYSRGLCGVGSGSEPWANRGKLVVAEPDRVVLEMDARTAAEIMALTGSTILPDLGADLKTRSAVSDVYMVLRQALEGMGLSVRYAYFHDHSVHRREDGPNTDRPLFVTDKA